MPKQILSVRPLKRAYQPKYPSHADPNPIDHPETRPYPFSQKMIDALGKAGFVGALMLSPLAVDAQAEDVRSENPFPVAKTNLPYVPISYGTGQPSRLSREDVIDFIHQVFIKEGLQPKRDQLVTADSLRITADSYDESCNIGFVWLDHTNFGPGMRQEHYYDWRATARSQEQAYESTLNGLEQEYRYYQRDTVRYLSRLVNNTYLNRPIDHDLQRDFTEKLPTLKTAEAQAAYFIERLAEFRYLEHLNRYQALEGYDAYVELLERISAIATDSIEKYSLAWRTHSITKFLSVEHAVLRQAMLVELQNVAALTDVEEWRKALEWLITYSQLDDQRRYLGYNTLMEEDFAAVLNAKTAKERAHKYELLVTMIDEQEVSLAEARKLEEAATEGEYFIAPISIFDDRSIYRTNGQGATAEERQRLKELIEKAQNATLEEERRSYRQAYYELQSIISNKEVERGKLQSLKLLEEEVRSYIRWAKAQQGY